MIAGRAIEAGVAACTTREDDDMMTGAGTSILFNFRTTQGPTKGLRYSFPSPLSYLFVLDYFLMLYYYFLL